MAPKKSNTFVPPPLPATRQSRRLQFVDVDGAGSSTRSSVQRAASTSSLTGGGMGGDGGSLARVGDEAINSLFFGSGSSASDFFSLSNNNNAAGLGEGANNTTASTTRGGRNNAGARLPRGSAAATTPATTTPAAATTAAGAGGAKKRGGAAAANTTQKAKAANNASATPIDTTVIEAGASAGRLSTQSPSTPNLALQHHQQQQLLSPISASATLPSVVPSPLPFLRRMCDLRQFGLLFVDPTPKSADGGSKNDNGKRHSIVSVTVLGEDEDDDDQNDDDAEGTNTRTTLSSSHAAAGSGGSGYRLGGVKRARDGGDHHVDRTAESDITQSSSSTSSSVITPSAAIVAVQKGLTSRVYTVALAAVVTALRVHAEKFNTKDSTNNANSCSGLLSTSDVSLLKACEAAYRTALFPFTEGCEGRPAVPFNHYNSTNSSNNSGGYNPHHHHTASFMLLSNVLVALEKMAAIDAILRKATNGRSSGTAIVAVANDDDAAAEKEEEEEECFDDHFRIPSAHGISVPTARAFMRQRQDIVGSSSSPSNSCSITSLWELSWRLWTACNITATHIDKHWLVRDRASYVRHHAEVIVMVGAASPSSNVGSFGKAGGRKSAAHHLSILGVATALAAEALTDCRSTAKVGGATVVTLPTQCAMLLTEAEGEVGGGVDVASPSFTNSNGPTVYTIPPIPSEGANKDGMMMSASPSSNNTAITSETQANQEYRSREAILTRDVYLTAMRNSSNTTTSSSIRFVNSFSTIRNAATSAHKPSRDLLKQLFAEVDKDGQLSSSSMADANVLMLSMDDVLATANHTSSLTSTSMTNGRRELVKHLLTHMEAEDGLPRYMRYVHRMQTTPTATAGGVGGVGGARSHQMGGMGASLTSPVGAAATTMGSSSVSKSPTDAFGGSTANTRNPTVVVVSSIEGLYPTPMDLPLSHFPWLNQPDKLADGGKEHGGAVTSPTTASVGAGGVAAPATSVATSANPTATQQWSNYECGLQSEIIQWFDDSLWQPAGSSTAAGDGSRSAAGGLGGGILRGLGGSGGSGLGGGGNRPRKLIYPVLITAPAPVVPRLLMQGGGTHTTTATTTLLDVICKSMLDATTKGGNGRPTELLSGLSSSSSGGEASDSTSTTTLLKQRLLVATAAANATNAYPKPTNGFHSVVALDAVKVALLADASANGCSTSSSPTEAMRAQMLEVLAAATTTNTNTSNSSGMYGFVVFFHNFTKDASMTYYVGAVVEM